MNRPSEVLSARIPILMYHSVGSNIRVGHPYFETNTSREVFAAHMRYLADHGYRTFGLNHAMETIQTGRPTSKSVVITFDDGYRNFYHNAFPVLQKHRFKATMFVVGDFAADQPRQIRGNEYMCWREIREVHASGTSIGSHTMTHPELHTMRSVEIQRELSRSKALIEDKLGISVDCFAYPYAFPEHDKKFVAMFRSLLRSTEYSCGVSTIIGTANQSSDVYSLPRIPVNSYDDIRLFEAKLNGGYDWLHSIQYFYKRLKLAN